MEAYFETKASLFLPTQSRLAVVNVDDRWGQLLADRIDAERLITVRGSDASDVVLSVGSSSFRWRGIPMTIPLSGRFNVDNALMAATITSALGVDIDDIGTGLSSVSPIPGRMEVVSGTSQTAVLVDFAHTPAGLDAALSAARDLAGHGRVICLFGCGGDRDQGKRSEMGEVAARWADAIVLTSDNPRSEDPLAIIDQIKSGIDGAVELTVEPDRRRAIETAVGLGEPGDVVVIAGKGHETNQVQGDRVVPFDDRLEAKQALAHVGRSGNPNPGDEQP
jgi:UDP-N-acetylmuramoyl-L-alanyl-D-glutamate--2,6-diaminopimelate ligase